MSFFQKAAQAGGSIFKKVAPVLAERGFFKKSGAGRKFSNALGQAAGVTGMIGRALRQGANNPVLEGAGNMLFGRDRTSQLQNRALAGSGYLKGASGVLQRASDITNRKNLRGNAQEEGANVLERTKNLKRDTQALFI